jgi:hypothetical protein
MISPAEGHEDKFKPDVEDGKKTKATGKTPKELLAEKNDEEYIKVFQAIDEQTCPKVLVKVWREAIKHET